MNNNPEKEQLEASYKLGRLLELAWHVWHLAMTLKLSPPFREEKRVHLKKCFRHMYDQIKMDAPEVIFILEGCLNKFDSDLETYLLPQNPPPRISKSNSAFRHPTKVIISSSHAAGIYFLKYYFLDTNFWNDIADDFEFDCDEIEWVNDCCQPEKISMDLQAERMDLLRSVFSKVGSVAADYSFNDLLNFTSLGRTRLNQHLENASHEMPHAGLKKGINERHSREQVSVLLEFILTQNPIDHVRNKCKESLKVLRDID